MTPDAATKTKMRAVEACLLAGIHPSRLNEAIAAGLYSSAPKTKPGSARLFSEDDVVALAIFADLIKFGFSKAAANRTTTKIMKSGSASLYDGDVEYLTISVNHQPIRDRVRAAFVAL